MDGHGDSFHVAERPDKEEREETVGGRMDLEALLERILGDPNFPEGKAWRRRRLKPNQAIVREGEKGCALFYVEQGTLRVTGRVRLENAQPVRPGFCDLGPGDLFGELSLFGDGPRAATVMAVEAAQVVELDGVRLRRHLDAHPRLGYAFLCRLYEMLAERLRRADRQLEGLIAWGLRAHGIERHL